MDGDTGGLFDELLRGLEAAQEREKADPTDSILCDVSDVMRATRLGRTTIYALMADGSLESVRCGRRRLVPRAALVGFCEALRAAAQNAGAAL